MYMKGILVVAVTQMEKFFWKDLGGEFLFFPVFGTIAQKGRF